MLKKLAIGFAVVLTAAAFAQPAGAAIDGSAGAMVATAQLAPETDLFEATTADESCASGYLCFWVHADYLGQKGRFAGNNPHWSDYPQPTCGDGNWNDCASSAKNRGTSCTAHLHQHSSYGGDRHSIGRGGNRPHLSAHDFNDKASSNSWC